MPLPFRAKGVSLSTATVSTKVDFEVGFAAKVMFAELVLQLYRWSDDPGATRSHHVEIVSIPRWLVRFEFRHR
jgi:hypothetical protein